MAHTPYDKSGGSRNRHLVLPAFLDAKSRSSKAKRASGQWPRPSKVRDAALAASAQTRDGERYFALHNNFTGETINGFRFKEEAKSFRNRLNQEAGSPTLWRICPGPDRSALGPPQTNEKEYGC